VICTGRLTRLARFFVLLQKEYRGTILFGRETDTLDLSGRTVRRSAVPHDLFERARELLPALTGRHLQAIPQFSAAKWKGKPFHRWVRAGQSPPPRAREVELFDVEILKVNRSFRRLDFKVVVSSGFYVRSWVRDLGANLGVPATLCRLVRTRVGVLRLRDALPAADLSFEKISDGVIRGKDVLDWIPSLSCSEVEIRRLRDGKVDALQPYGSAIAAHPVTRILDPRGDIAAMVGHDATGVKPLVILTARRENQ
jgi:tRNA pseudouridine55 synthase